MLEQFKKNWFVLVVALVLLIATGFYIKDQTKNNVKSKTVDGKQVVFSIAGKNFFADDFQKLADEQYGNSALYQIYERELLRNIETSDDIKSEAKLSADERLTYIKQTQGQAGLDSLDAQMVGMGYDGIDSFTEYFENLLKYEELVTNHFMSNYDRLFKKYVDEKQPIQVSHILIKVAEKGKPTEEEQKKIKAVEDALKESSFDQVAATLSEDSSKEKAGSLGVIDKDEKFVPEFMDAAYKLKKGEVSEWVESSYGKHLIKVDETEFVKLLKEPTFFEEMTTEHAKEVSIAMWKVTKEINIEFLKDGVEDRLLKILGLTKEDI